MRDQPDNRAGRPAAATHRVAAAGDLVDVRRSVAGFARTAGLVSNRVDKLVVALSEVATNAIMHGGGAATVTMARNKRQIVVTVSDSGGPGDGQFPPAGASRPDPVGLGGRGLWITRQLCDEVTIDSLPAGTRVQLVMRL